MILGIDIGNTTVEFGLIDGECITSYKFSSDRTKTIDDWLINIDFVVKSGKTPQEIIISSVVPQIEERLEKALQKYFGKKPLILGKDLEIPIKVNYDSPKDVGTDRLLNAYAGKVLAGAPLVVVDLGTAITFDVVNCKGEYEGGAIFPGMETSIDTLFARTAKLPKIKLEKPDGVVGKNTISSMQSGIYYGYISLIEGMVERIKKETGPDISIILTGGHSKFISSGINLNCRVVENLAMVGIGLIGKHSLTE